MKMIAFFLFSAVAFGQQETVVQLANTPTAQGFQEMATTLRTVGDISQLSMDSTKNSFTLHGTADQLAFGEWLIHAMDKPAGAVPYATEPDLAARQYQFPGGRDPVAHVYYLTNPGNPQVLQEILTNLRVVADVQKVYSYFPQRMLAFRGTAVRVAFAEWMIHQLDVPADGKAFALQNQNHASYMFKLPDPQRDGTEDIAQVIYLDPAMNAQDVNGLLRTMRTTGNIEKVFSLRSPPAIVVRGNPVQLAAVEQMIASH